MGCFSLAGLSILQSSHKLVDEIFSASMLYVMKFRTDMVGVSQGQSDSGGIFLPDRKGRESHDMIN